MPRWLRSTPSIGEVEILDYVIVEDCGTLVNPMVVDGQTLGGVAQGIGTAMYEESRYDSQRPAARLDARGLPAAGRDRDPGHAHLHMQTPSPYTAFGIKGMGEGGAIAPPAVIFNAVNDALQPLGVEVTQTPLTPRRLLKPSSAPRRCNSGPRERHASPLRDWACVA